MTGTRRASAVLALGSVASGLLAYVLFVLITRGLGAAAAAPVSVLWTQWAFAGAALTFPIQHWITRTLTAGREDVVRRAAPQVALLVAALAVVLGLLAWLARDDLFHRQDAWFPLMIAMVTVGSAVIGVTRGGLGGRGRFTAVAWSLVAENGLRCVLVSALLLADVRNPVAHGLCLVAGQLVVVLWPSALRYAGSAASGPDGGPLAFLSGTAVAQLVSQTVLTGAPVLLALAGGAPHEVTSMFAALALFRAPYVVAVGSVPQLTVRVTQRSLAGEQTALRTLVRSLLVVTVVAAGVAGLVGAWIGPELLRLVFGDTVEVPAGQAAVMVAGCTVAVANLLLMVVALAEDRPGSSAWAWAVAVVAGMLGFVALSGQEPVAASTGTFLVAEVAALMALSVVALRAMRTTAGRA